MACLHFQDTLAVDAAHSTFHEYWIVVLVANDEVDRALAAEPVVFEEAT